MTNIRRRKDRFEKENIDQRLMNFQMKAECLCRSRIAKESVVDIPLLFYCFIIRYSFWTSLFYNPYSLFTSEFHVLCSILDILFGLRCSLIDILFLLPCSLINIRYSILSSLFCARYSILYSDFAVL